MTVTVAKFAARAARAPITALALLVLGSATVAAQSPAVATDTWIKVCRNDEKAKKEECRTAYDLRTSGGQFLAAISVVEASGEARKILHMIMPTGLLLQPGLKVQVDQNKGEDAKFSMCAPDGCIAMLATNEAFVASMKKGGELTLTAYGQASNPVTFTFPLATFKAGNEGKPLDEAALKKREEAISAEVAQRQKSIEDQLREEQRKATQAKP